MREINQNHREFSSYYDELHYIADDHDSKPCAPWNAIGMSSSEKRKDSYTNSGIPSALPECWMVRQEQDDRIRERPTEKPAQNQCAGSGFASSPRTPRPPRTPAEAPAGTVAGYMGPAPMDSTSGSSTTDLQKRAKRFGDGRCVCSGGFIHKAAECAATKLAQK